MCVHGDACAHTCMGTRGASSSRLRSLPIVTPPICHQPAESIMSDKSVGLQGSISISISPPQFLSFSHHTISLSHHPHTTLSCQEIVSVSKLLKHPAPHLHFPFRVVLSSYFYVLLENSPACSNLPLTPLFRLYLTFR